MFKGALFAFVVIVFLLFAHNANACHLKTRTYEYPPFATKSADGQWSGMELDYARALTQVMDCKLTVIEVPWARSIDMLKSGDIDFMLEVSKTPLREQYMHFVGPQRIEMIHLITHQNVNPLISSWGQLDKLDAVLMRQKGAYLGDRFEQVLNTNRKLSSRFVELPNSAVRVILLTKGRIDGFLVDGVYFNYLMNSEPQAHMVKRHPLEIHRNPVYFAFSKASVSGKTMEQVQRAFSALASRGDFERIFQHYNYKSK